MFAATPARSSDSRDVTSSAGSYGSNTSVYSSKPSSRVDRRPRSSSRSGSGPASGSNSSLGTKSICTPRRAPARSSWLTSSRRRGTTVPRSSLRAISRRARRKLSAWSAMPWARSSRSLLRPASSVVIDRSSPLEGSSECHFVGVFQISPDRQAARKPGHPQPHGFEQPCQICGGCLTLEVGIGREDHLRDGAVSETLHQLADAQLVGSDALDGADRAAEDVVAALELTCALDRDDVLGLLDHTDQRVVSTRIPADLALVLFGDVAADRAEPHPGLDLEHRLC